MKTVNRIITSFLCSVVMLLTMCSPLTYASEVTAASNVTTIAGVVEKNVQSSKKSPKLNKTSYTLDKGKSVKLKVSNNSGKVTWYTSNKKIATVSKSGTVTAKKTGNATITAKLKSGKKLTCKIKVKAAVSNTVVYITRTGHKYHKSWCRYLRQSKIKTTLREAKSRGYDPCKVCFG